MSEQQQTAFEKAKAKAEELKARAAAEKLQTEKTKASVTPPATPEEAIEVTTTPITTTTSDEPKVANSQPLPAEEITVVAPLPPAKIDKSGQIIFTQKHLDLIKSQIAPKATQEEFELFIMMARRTSLDPLLRQLHFVKYGEGDRAKVAYITSIDGYRIIAHRTGLFAGKDEPTLYYDGKLISSCAVTVYKMVQGVRCPFTAKVSFREYTTGKNNWQTMPETMISKVAEAHALRSAFPQDLSGVYTQEEMDQADNRQPVAQPAPDKILKSQVEQILLLIKRKGKTTEQLTEFITKTFKKSSRDLTKLEANKVIVVLNKLPDPPKDDISEAAEEIFGAKMEETPVVSATKIDTQALVDDVEVGLSGIDPANV